VVAVVAGRAYPAVGAPPVGPTQPSVPSPVGPTQPSVPSPVGPTQPSVPAPLPGSLTRPAACSSARVPASTSTVSPARCRLPCGSVQSLSSRTYTIDILPTCPGATLCRAPG